MGLGFDYTEIDLWWLVAYKRRLYQFSQYKTGQTIFHQFLDDTNVDTEKAKASILKSFGVEVIVHDISHGYAEAFERIVQSLRQ